MMRFFQILLLFTMSFLQIKAQESPENIDLESISQDFLYAVRTGEIAIADSLKLILKNTNWTFIQGQINTDEKKKAFWLNIYNAFIQDILSKNAGAYQNRNKFFGKNQIAIANRLISFDFIEHGILRRSKSKISLGYWNKLLTGKLERQLRVEKLDYRIHFALNCGASSCPPIAYYESKEIDTQLNLAEKSFLTSNSTVNIEKKQVNVTALLSWFRADFGGKKGIRALLVKNEIIPNKNYKLQFDRYNWDLELNKYAE